MDRKGSAGGRLGVIQLCAFVWTPSLRRTSDSGVGDDLPNQAALGLFAFYSERLWRQSRKNDAKEICFVFAIGPVLLE